MHRLRITGIVRQAEHLRRALASPLTAEQRDDLVRHVARTLHDVDAILAQHGATPKHLPAQSQHAYRFLMQTDLSKVATVTSTEIADDASPPRPETVTFRGIKAFLEQTLDNVARRVHERTIDAGATRDVIRRTAERLDHSMTRDGLEALHLTPQTRQLVAWYRYFSDEESFNDYVAAVGRAQAALASVQVSTGETPVPHDTGRKPMPRGWRPPVLPHFRPSSHLYRWRGFADATRIVFDTPMIAVDDAVWRAIADQIRGTRAHRRAIADAMESDAYQSVLVELDAAGGVVEQTRGMVYDLAASFRRVDERYFRGAVPRPKLIWNRRLTGRKFGHYDFVRDLICISSTLDHPKVPEFVLDHVMHHELLHKKHGLRWHNNRRHAHTPEFRNEERAFHRYADADHFLNHIHTHLR